MNDGRWYYEDSQCDRIEMENLRTAAQLLTSEQVDAKLLAMGNPVPDHLQDYYARLEDRREYLVGFQFIAYLKKKRNEVELKPRPPIVLAVRIAGAPGSSGLVKRTHENTPWWPKPKGE